MNTLIIASAGNPQNMLFPGVYDLMIPINGKPVINYILENIDNWKVSKIIILLNINDINTKKYIEFLKIPNVEIICKNIDTQSLWESLLCAQKFVWNEEKIIIQLWDTILAQNLNFEHDFISVSRKQILEPEKWTFIDHNLNIYDKTSSIPEKNLFLVNGVYYIKSIKRFFDFLKQMNFYETLEKYFKENKWKLIEHNSKYYDVGHLEEYYKSKIDFLRVRSFNSLEYDNFRGIIKKKSSNIEKLSWEINWFRNIPKDLQVFTPRLIDYSLWENTNYSLEFYWYSSLADIFLYSSYPQSYLENIISKILNYIRYVKENYNDVYFSKSHLYSIYLDKTIKRENDIYKSSLFWKIKKQAEIIINGKRYKTIHTILKPQRLINIIEHHIYDVWDFTILHGDMCFSNILFDTYNWIFKFIDPRGNFGDIWIWGDIKYDLAKFRHSVHGKYENIISDLYNLEVIEEAVSYNFEYFNSGNTVSLVQYFDKQIIDDGYNIDVIKFIEWLLYYSMIPLHTDSQERQLIMYFTATILLNETLELWN